MGGIPKRIFDIVSATTLVIALSPVLIGAAFLIRLVMGRPILFRQVRPGRNGVPFVLYKFRTMREARDARGEPLPDSARLTGLGNILRRSSVDELPQLLNVIQGHMSLVGPRPLLMEYLPLYTDEQMRRHDVRPGITGWAQINGRNDLSWEEKFALDIWYVDNWSMRLDLIILARSVSKVLHGSGVSRLGHATTEKFTGSNFRGNTPS
jgi:sugar transferase EpsL